MRYRKKPVTVEALRYSGANRDEIMAFVGKDCCMDGDRLYIHTLEGDMLVSDGDYVIRGVRGEYYPCKPDVFEVTYQIESEGRTERT